MVPEWTYGVDTRPATPADDCACGRYAVIVFESFELVPEIPWCGDSRTCSVGDDVLAAIEDVLAR